MLFAALNVLDPLLIAQCQKCHIPDEWLKLLRQIDRQTPKDKTLHLIADNYSTHKHSAKERSRHLAESHSRQQPIKFQTERNISLVWPFPAVASDFYNASARSGGR